MGLTPGDLLLARRTGLYSKAIAWGQKRRGAEMDRIERHEKLREAAEVLIGAMDKTGFAGVLELEALRAALSETEER